MPQRIFLEANIVASIVWILSVSSIGYLAGFSFMVAKHYLKYAEVGVLIFILVLV
jgi:membrane protein DedA with SNARE-associated domain